MHFQCTECDKRKGDCKCKHPSFIQFLDEKNSKKISQKNEKGNERKEIRKVKGFIGPYFVESIILDRKDNVC